MKIRLSIFMRGCAIAMIGFGVFTGTAAAQAAGPPEEQLGWKLGAQAWSFKEFTFFEAVDKTKALGLGYIEAFPGQRIENGSDAKFLHTMDADTRQKVADKLKSAGVKLAAYGVVGGSNEAEWRQIFEFAKSLGISSISSEPKPEEMDLMEALCEEYGVNLAVHNHPKPSFYWSPDTFLDAVKGRSKRIGACVDDGHWLRSGLDPLECLRKLEGRVISLHFKDITSGAEPHDVPWGTGSCNVYGLLAELKRQEFKGLFSIEYEYNWLESMPEIQQSVDYYRLVATALAEKGYKPLFQSNLKNAVCSKDSWSYEDGVLAAKGGGDIWTKEQYGDFVLDLEFRCESETNSGVFLRCTDTVEWLQTSIEVQILQPEAANTRENCGGIFDCLAPAKRLVKAPGEWNRYVIIAKGSRILVFLNGEQATDMNLDLWTEAHKNPDGTANKFNTAYKDMARTGFVGFQYHGMPVQFRNMKIKPLDAAE